MMIASFNPMATASGGKTWSGGTSISKRLVGRAASFGGMAYSPVYVLLCCDSHNHPYQNVGIGPGRTGEEHPGPINSAA